jgi:hypothetical protein
VVSPFEMARTRMVDAIEYLLEISRRSRRR